MSATERLGHYRTVYRRPGIQLLAQWMGRTALLAFASWVVFRWFPTQLPPPYLVGVWVSWFIVGVLYGLWSAVQAAWLTFRGDYLPGAVVGSGLTLLFVSIYWSRPILQAASSVHMMLTGGGVVTLVIGALFGGAIQEGSYRVMSALINLAWHGLHSVLDSHRASAHRKSGL